MRVARVSFGPRPNRRAVGVDRLHVHDAPPVATAATTAVIVVVWVMALVTVIVALAPRPTADEA